MNRTSKAILLWEIVSGRINVSHFRQKYRIGLLDGLISEELEKVFAEYRFSRFFWTSLS